MQWSNYHTHTVFCDGRDTPEELIEEALRLGCPELGFSGHSYTDFDESWCMSREGTEEYRRRVTELKQAYSSRIRLLLGVEQDIYSGAPEAGWDYVIGSVHYVRRDGCYLPVDESREIQEQLVRDFYGGDFYGFVEDYYAAVAEVYEQTHCDIVGHFDLITKFNEGSALFDTAHPRYIAAADRALETLLKTPARFELNTGAMARGYRSSPYPEMRLCRRIEAAGKRLIKSSDCHDRRLLLYGF